MARLTLKVLGKPVAIVLLRRSGEQVPEQWTYPKWKGITFVLNFVLLQTFSLYSVLVLLAVFIRGKGVLAWAWLVWIQTFERCWVCQRFTFFPPSGKPWNYETTADSSGVDTGATSGAKPCPGTRSEEKFPWERWGPSQERKKVGKQTFPVRTQVYQASKLPMVGNDLFVRLI